MTITFPESKKEISNGAIAALQQIIISGISGNWETKLPRLSSQVYKEIDEILRAMRGQYVVGKKVHRFSYDPESAIAKVIQTRKIPLANPNAFFPTPVEIVNDLLDEVDYPENIDSMSWKECRVLEPSAGDGAIVRLMCHRNNKIPVDAIEVDPVNVQILNRQKLENVNLIEADFLSVNLKPCYLAIVVNPPFSTRQDPQAWVKHIEKCLTLLRPNGKLAFIAPDSFQHSNNANIVALRHEMGLRNAYIRKLPNKSFQSSGTSVSTVLISCFGTSQKETEKLSRPYNGFPSWWAWNLAKETSAEREFHDAFIELAKCSVLKTSKESMLTQGRLFVNKWLYNRNKSCDDGFLMGIPGDQIDLFVQEVLGEIYSDLGYGDQIIPSKTTCKQLSLF